VVVAGGRRGDEGAVAGAPVEDEPVPPDPRQLTQFGDAFEFQFGDVNREELVVVALIGDAGVKEDVVVDDREAEARRFALPRHEVVDVDFGQGDGDAGQGVDRGDFARPHFGLRRAGARVFHHAQIALRGGGLGVDAEPGGKIDPHGPQVADRDLPDDRARFLFDDELGEADLGMTGGLFEELRRGVDAAGGSVRVAGTGLPAVVCGGRVVLRGDDFRLCSRACPGYRPQSQKHTENNDPNCSSPAHPDLLRSVHLKDRLPDFDDLS
jgi:hypothetical protein